MPLYHLFNPFPKKNPKPIAQPTARFPAYVNSLKLKRPDGAALTLDAEGNGTFRDLVKSCLVVSARTGLSPISM